MKFYLITLLVTCATALTSCSKEELVQEKQQPQVHMTLIKDGAWRIWVIEGEEMPVFKCDIMGNKCKKNGGSIILTTEEWEYLYPELDPEDYQFVDPNVRPLVVNYLWNKQNP